MSLPTTIFNPKIPTSLHTRPPSQNFTPQKIQLFSKNLNFNFLRTFSLPSTFHFTTPQQTHNLNDDNEEEEQPIGDCVVFEEGIFEDPFARNELGTQSFSKNESKSKPRKNAVQVREENLVPEEWREVQAELNMSKKDRRKIAREVEFGSRVLRKKKGLVPLRDVNLEEYMAFREAKLRMLNPVELDDPESEDEEMRGSAIESERVEPKNPKWAVYGRGLDDVTEFFNSGGYVPGENKPQGRQKLFTKEEKIQLNRKIPDLALATSKKWLPLHALAASGEFYLTDALLKHNVDINAADKDGLTALHKAIIGKKQAITNYLLRESADPFVRDKDGATLLHYAVQTGSSQAIKVLLLYNVDINLQDNAGWTPLHLAVQGRRTDVVRLLLIKGADNTLKNRDGLTPLDLCLYSGRDTRTYELIKLLKTLPKPYKVLPQEAES